MAQVHRMLFDVVIPSLPGYGFSGKPTTTGWDPIRIARAWIVLMKRLGYTRFVAQGGDWGNAVTEQMALQAPPELTRHSHQYAGHCPGRRCKGTPVRRPAAIRSLSRRDGTPTTSSTSSISTAWAMPTRWRTARRRSTRLADSPVGLAAWMLDHDAAQLRAHRARLRRSG